MPIGDILRNHVKEKLARDEVVASMTVRLVRGIEIARIAATAGFDTLYIDLEHSSFSLDTTGQICMAALAAGITPFVRVPANTLIMFHACSTAARSASLRRMSARRRRLARW
jgi:4-hydroxy-2-oxoheptanedioate aldolase